MEMRLRGGVEETSFSLHPVVLWSVRFFGCARLALWRSPLCSSFSSLRMRSSTSYRTLSTRLIGALSRKIMSLDSDYRGVGSAAAEGAVASGERVPLLRAGGYAAWKPAMDVYLQRHGAADVHKDPLSEEDWLADSSCVAWWA